MKWKKRLSGLILFLTLLLPFALCNHKSGDDNEVRLDGANGQSLVPGHQTAILQNGHVIHLDHLRLLDPYNLIASVKKNGNKLNPFLAELLPHNSLDVENSPDRLDEDKSKHHKAKRKFSKGGAKRVNSLTSSTNDDSHTSVNVTENKTKSTSQTKEDPYFNEGDFDLYDDYEDLGSTKKDFNYKTNTGRRRKKGNSRSAAHNALLHEAVRKLLGFSHSKSGGQKSSRLLPDPYGEKKMPRYVKDLYERFQSGEMNAGLAQGNTIRSIYASMGDVEGEAMFLFNLTSLRSSEQLLNAEIHLYKRRPRSKNHKLDIDVKLYRVAPHYLSQVDQISMRDVSHGWQWYDVTSAIRNCLTPRRRHRNLFALSFRMNKPNGKVKSVSLRKFGRHHSMPFLVLYSNETEAVSFEQLDILTNRLWPKEGPHRAVNRATNSVIHRHGKSNSDNSSETDTIHQNQDRQNLDRVKGQQPFEKFVKRGKRSIYDNEIPEGPEEEIVRHKHKFPRYNTVPRTHPGILETKKESRIDIKSSFFPLSNSHGNGMQRRRRKKHRNKKHHRKNNRPAFPKEWESYAGKNNVVEGGATDVCGRKRLTVDFADIGWGDWIISPKSFEAHYCDGACPFPFNKRLRPSNHATIQSIVHAIGIHRHVPAPCCVPDKMSSVTLLYFDEDRNVVLKNYPGMTVESCACR